jgi:hypothetical protein
MTQPASLRSQLRPPTAEEVKDMTQAEKDIQKQAKAQLKEAKQASLAPKPGVQTSEFWAVTIPTIVALVAAILKVTGVDVDVDSATAALLVIGPAAGSIYAAARAYLKKGRLQAAASNYAVRMSR